MRPIDADSLKNHIRNTYCKECIEYNGFNETRCFACRIDDIIEDLGDTNYSPTLDVRPNIHAHWEDFSAVCDGAVCCSYCHIGTIKTYEFCPHCGAVMDEEVNNNA